MLTVQFEKFLGHDHRVGEGRPSTKKSDFLTYLVGCIADWNQNGRTRLEKCRSGINGAKSTQEWARKINYQEFALDNLLGDLKTYPSPPYSFGRAGSHLWISRKDGERLILITFCG